MARTSGARISTFAAKAACWPSAILHGNYTKANKHITLMNRMCRMACITNTSVTLRVTLRPAVACCCLAWLGLAWLGLALWRLGCSHCFRRTRSYEILHGLGDSQWSVAADYYQKARHAQSFRSSPPNTPEYQRLCLSTSRTTLGSPTVRKCRWLRRVLAGWFSNPSREPRTLAHCTAQHSAAQHSTA
jgi:hypothetical protein